MEKLEQLINEKQTRHDGGFEEQHQPKEGNIIKVASHDIRTETIFPIEILLCLCHSNYDFFFNT